MPLSPALLEHAAQQSGFDLDRDAPAPWRSFSSSRAPLRVWLRGEPDGALVAALSMGNVDAALAQEGLGETWAGERPAGAVSVRRVADRPALHRLLRRAWPLIAASSSLPAARRASMAKDTDRVMKRWEKDIAKMLPNLNPAIVLAELTPEQRLAGLAPEQRLAGLAPDEALRALPVEVLRGLSEDYLRTLSPETLRIIRARLAPTDA